jgi:hypothetical protein
MAKLITAKDIEAAAASGQRTVSFGPGVIVTPAAKDRARELGVTIANGASAAPAATPAATSVAAPGAAPSSGNGQRMFVPVQPPPQPAAPPGTPTFIPPSQPVVQGPATSPAPPGGPAGITNLKVEVQDREKPVYFESPVIDNLFNITLELGAALWVVKDRLRVVEELLDQKGVLRHQEVELYRTPPEREREIRAKRDQFIEKIYRSIRDNPG